MVIHDWIMDIHNRIMDVHNWILDIFDSWILWIAIPELWTFMIDYVYTLSRCFIRFWISKIGILSYFQPIFSIALHHACHNIMVVLRHKRFHKIYTIAGPRGWKRNVFFSSRFQMNCQNISLWSTNRDYKTGQSCYDRVWADFTRRDDVQLNLTRD